MNGGRIIHGTLTTRLLPEYQGRLVTVVPLLFGAARLTIVERYPRCEDDELTTWDRAYDYPSVDAALAAMNAWEDGSKAPPGDFIRKVP